MSYEQDLGGGGPLICVGLGLGFRVRVRVTILLATLYTSKIKQY